MIKLPRIVYFGIRKMWKFDYFMSGSARQLKFGFFLIQWWVN